MSGSEGGREHSYDFKMFDVNFRRLLSLCSKIVKLDERRSRDADSGSTVRATLIKYTRCYDMTPQEDVENDHVDLFKEMYQQYREDIINDGHKNTDWITNNNIVIVYGSNIGAGDKSRIRIYLSSIYQMAVDLCNFTKARMRRNPDGDYSDCEELNYPDAFFLYLYRIFKTWKHPAQYRGDRQNLNVIVMEIEDILGLSDDSSSTNGGGQGLDGLMKFAQGITGKVGDLQKDGTLPDTMPDDVGATLRNIFSNPDIGNLINSTFKNMSESNDVGTAVSSLVNGLSDPRMKNAVSDSFKNPSTSTSQGEDHEVENGKQEDPSSGIDREA